MIHDTNLDLITVAFNPCYDILFIKFMLSIHAYLVGVCCSLMVINS